MNISLCVCMYVYICMCIYIYVCMCMCVNMFVCLGVGMCVQQCLCRGQGAALCAGLHCPSCLSQFLFIFCPFQDSWPASGQVLSCLCFPSHCGNTRIALPCYHTCLYMSSRVQTQVFMIERLGLLYALKLLLA